MIYFLIMLIFLTCLKQDNAYVEKESSLDTGLIVAIGKKIHH